MRWWIIFWSYFKRETKICKMLVLTMLLGYFWRVTKKNLSIILVNSFWDIKKRYRKEERFYTGVTSQHFWSIYDKALQYVSTLKIVNHIKYDFCTFTSSVSRRRPKARRIELAVHRPTEFWRQFWCRCGPIICPYYFMASILWPGN